MLRKVARIDRILGMASLVPAIGAPETRGAARRRICEQACPLVYAQAAAIFLRDGNGISCAAWHGLALLPPEGLLSAFDEGSRSALARWATVAGFEDAEIAPLDAAGETTGWLVLFVGAAVESLEATDLDRLGSIAVIAMERAGMIEELAAASQTQLRQQEQTVRTERLHALGEMALCVAHSFNNVLNAILSQVGVIEVMVGDQAEIRQAVDRLKASAVGGARTVARLQDFCRIRRDKEFAPVGLSALVDEAAGIIRAFGPPGLVVEHDVEPCLWVTGDRDELREAIGELAANALGAMASGGRLAIRLRKLDKEVTLLVDDSGHGMSREVRKRAFDPFFTTKGSRAAGLGLSVAYGIVRRHGGNIELESMPDRGTRLRIRLPPLAPPAAESTSQAAPAQRAEHANLRVLLVEDDADNRDAMAALLELHGFQVTVAETGGEGTRRFTEGTFDVVVTDLGLPDMTGWKIADAIKEISSATPVVVVTGWGLNLSRDEITRRGVDLLVRKPIDPHRFMKQLGTLAVRSD